MYPDTLCCGNEVTTVCGAPLRASAESGLAVP